MSAYEVQQLKELCTRYEKQIREMLDGRPLPQRVVWIVRANRTGTMGVFSSHEAAQKYVEETIKSTAPVVAGGGRFDTERSTYRCDGYEFHIEPMQVKA